jgi:hypothetical protein
MPRVSISASTTASPGNARRWRSESIPTCHLPDAREKRDRARKLLSDAIDPGAQRKAIRASEAHRAANSFEVVAREWFAKFSSNWAASHASKIIRRLERDILPWIGARPVADVTAPELLAVLRRIERALARLLPAHCHIANFDIAVLHRNLSDGTGIGIRVGGDETVILERCHL